MESAGTSRRRIVSSVPERATVSTLVSDVQILATVPRNTLTSSAEPRPPAYHHVVSSVTFGPVDEQPCASPGSAAGTPVIRVLSNRQDQGDGLKSDSGNPG